MVRNWLISSHFILSLFGLDAKETKVIVQQIANDLSSRDCPYCHDSITTTRRSSQIIVGERILHDLQGWLTPPDPSTNYNIACSAQHERTSVWVFNEAIYKEWESTGSLFWIHGKGLSSFRRVYMSSESSFRSWLRKEHPLVCHAILSGYAKVYVLAQLRYHPACHRSA